MSTRRPPSAACCWRRRRPAVVDCHSGGCGGGGAAPRPTNDPTRPQRLLRPGKELCLHARPSRPLRNCRDTWDVVTDCSCVWPGRLLWFFLYSASGPARAAAPPRAPHPVRSLAARFICPVPFLRARDRRTPHERDLNSRPAAMHSCFARATSPPQRACATAYMHARGAALAGGAWRP